MKMMKQLAMNSMRLVAGACGLFLILATAQVGVAQQRTPKTTNQIVGASEIVAAVPAKQLSLVTKTGQSAPQAAKAEDEEETAAPSKPGSEGIKVHGHWVLQVKNADGTLGERREFNNSLVASGGMMTGDQLLAALLSGNATAGGLAIAFISGPSTNTSLDASSYCDAMSAGAPVGGQVRVPAGINCYGFYDANSALANCSAIESQLCPGQAGMTAAVSFAPAVNIVLSGNYTVPASLGALGVVNAVQTYAATCIPSTVTYAGFWRLTGSSVAFGHSSVAPSGCNSSPLVGQFTVANALTSTNITSGGNPAPLAVVTGQVITVTVTLSFS